MSTTQKNRLTKKDLVARWDRTKRTVERDIKRFGLMPADFIGIQPVFDEEAVKRMERRRLEDRCKQRGYPRPD